MHRSHSIRHPLKWTGLLFCTVLLFGWLISSWIGFAYIARGTTIGLSAGRLMASTISGVSAPNNDERGWLFVRTNWRHTGWKAKGSVIEFSNGVLLADFALPLWIPFVVFLVPTAYFF